MFLLYVYSYEHNIKKTENKVHFLNIKKHYYTDFLDTYLHMMLKLLIFLLGKTNLLSIDIIWL